MDSIAYLQVKNLLQNIQNYEDKIIDAKTQIPFDGDIGEWVSLVLYDDKLEYIYSDGRIEYEDIKDHFSVCTLEHQNEAMLWVLGEVELGWGEDFCRVANVRLAEKAYLKKLNILCLYNAKLGFVPFEDLSFFAEVHSPDWYCFDYKV